jgi:hypothetical protein
VQRSNGSTLATKYPALTETIAENIYKEKEKKKSSRTTNFFCGDQNYQLAYLHMMLFLFDQNKLYRE